MAQAIAGAARGREMQPLHILGLLCALVALLLVSLWAVPEDGLLAPGESLEVVIAAVNVSAAAANATRPPPTLAPEPFNATLQRLLDIEAALATIRAKQSNKTKGVYALTRPCGQTWCVFLCTNARARVQEKLTNTARRAATITFPSRLESLLHASATLASCCGERGSKW